MDDGAPLQLQGMAAVVTGGRYGIGRGIAEHLARSGAAVVVTDLLPGPDKVAHELCSDGFDAIGVQGDVRDRSSVEGMASAALDQFGRLDIWVNNAAAPRTARPILELGDEDWASQLDVNARGTLYGIQVAGRHMVAQGQGGRIINLASVAAFAAYPHRAHYSASKAAIVALTRTAGHELAPFGITVNAIAPGVVATPNYESLAAGQVSEEDGAYMRRLAEGVPIGHVGQPDDIAATATFLASPAAGYITGQTIVVDGGMLQSGG